MPPIPGKQIKDGTITTAKTAFTTPTQDAHPATKLYADTIDTNLRLLVKGLDAKASVRVASTTNIAALTGALTIDGVALNAGDSILVKSQTTTAQNGIWVVASGTWTRRDDADTSAKLTTGSVVYVEEGTTNGGKTFKLSTTGAITPGTTSQQWDVTGTTYYATPQAANKNMAASVTANDNDIACSTGIAGTPAQNSYVKVSVNGVSVKLADGQSQKGTSECFFSANGGTTAKAYNAIAINDLLYWVGSVSGYQLDSNDRIDFDYVV